MLSKEQREEIRARCEVATPGEWQTDKIARYSDHDECNVVMGDETIECFSYENAEFIAHARQDIPVLLEALEEREEALKGAAAVTNNAMQIIRDITADRDRLAARCAALERAIFENGFKCRLCIQSEKHLCQLRVKGWKCKDGDHWEFDEARFSERGSPE